MSAVTIFTDPKAYADPEGWHAVAVRLRREDPVPRIEVDGFDPFWAVTRHADEPRLETLELTGPAEYTAATVVGAPKRVPIRYRLRA